MATGHDIGTPMATNEEATEALASTHRLKLKPPTYDENYATFEEWKCKFKAYMGIQDNIDPDLLSRAERAATALTDAELVAAAGTPEEAERWIQLANNLKYILISTTSAAAATVCRQHQAAMGLEVYRQLCQRFSIPLGTRSIGYPTKLLKQTFNHSNFEESFSTWEFEVERHERDNNTQLPDQVKIAILMNEATGPLQQHLHLNAGQAPTYPMIREIITEHYRTTTAVARLQQQASSSVSTNYNGGPAPMDSSATYRGKGGRGTGNKAYKGKQQSRGYKGKGQGKGKGYGYNNGYGKAKGKTKGKQAWQPVKGTDKGQGKNKGANNEGKGKNSMAVCYRCGQPGHLAKDCKTAVYNLSDTTYEQQHDNTAQWYHPNNGYDASWYSSDQTCYYQGSGQQYQQPQQTPQLAPTAPQHTAAQEPQTPAIHLVAELDSKMSTTPTASTLQSVQQNEAKIDIMIDSGAATHVCPPWFAPNSPMYTLQHGQGPQLRTTTDKTSQCMDTNLS